MFDIDGMLNHPSVAGSFQPSQRPAKTTAHRLSSRWNTGFFLRRPSSIRRIRRLARGGCGIDRPRDASEASADARTRSIARRRSFKTAKAGRAFRRPAHPLAGAPPRPCEVAGGPSGHQAFSSRIRLQPAWRRRGAFTWAADIASRRASRPFLSGAASYGVALVMRTVGYIPGREDDRRLQRSEFSVDPCGRPFWREASGGWGRGALSPSRHLQSPIENVVVDM
jgi:hypothetical protein